MGDPGAVLIPLDAAGRDDAFFFGTLTHPAVLARVLRRSPGPDETLPATLPGWRRVKAANASYPVLVPDRDSSVDGLVLRRPGRLDLLRVNEFEDEEYTARLLDVRLNGRAARAWAFVPLPGVLEPSDEPWSLEAWAAEHMPAYLDDVDRWMLPAP